MMTLPILKDIFVGNLETPFDWHVTEYIFLLHHYHRPFINIQSANLSHLYSKSCSLGIIDQLHDDCAIWMSNSDLRETQRVCTIKDGKRCAFLCNTTNLV